MATQRSRLQTVHTPTSHELAVDQIRRAIGTGRFLPGDRLPAERELAGQLGVSRTTVRAALRVLQDEGLIETRRGRSGGPVVVRTDVPPAEARRAVRARLEQIEEVFDFRIAVEAACARLAAARRSQGDVDALRECLYRMDAYVEVAGYVESEVAPPSRFLAMDAEFHGRVAGAARNAMLAAAVEDARAAMFMPIGSLFRTLHPTANAHHDAIFEAIVAGDGARAEAAMVAHIEGTRETVREVAGATGRARRPAPRGRGGASGRA